MRSQLAQPSAIACRFALALLLTLTAAACGDDDDTNIADGKRSSTADAGKAGSGSDDPPSECELGCEATLDAACAMGPKTQLQCETDCERLRSGECGSQYRAYMECGDGEKVSCDAIGLPTVAACSKERQAFITCIQ